MLTFPEDVHPGYVSDCTTLFFIVYDCMQTNLSYYILYPKSNIAWDYSLHEQESRL